MAFVQSFAVFLGAIALSLFMICLGSVDAQQFDNVNGFERTERAYTPDVGLLDFVYHNHDDMTKFLR